MQQDVPPAESPRIEPRAIHPDARKVVRRLAGHGFDAYLVGGCVRDLLAGLQPKDFDIATSATPRQIKRLFRNSRIIGRRFRLVHIRFGARIVEVSTFRAPPEQEEGDPYIRRDNVFGDERQDAFRRDFTINGLFYDLDRGRVVDHVGGLEDLAARRVRTIGDAEQRVREDPVRILRAARFAGRLDFAWAEDLHEAAARHRGDLEKAAPPRLLEELYKLVSGLGSARAFGQLEKLGVLDVILPEITPLPDYVYDGLRGLERLGGGDRSRLSQSLMVAVLLAPIARRVLEDSEDHDYEARIHDAIRPVGLRLTVARRDLTRARQCLAAQLRLLKDPRGRAAHRFTRRDFFKESLVLRSLLGPVRAADPDPLPHWEELAHQTAADAASPPKPQRRRRRRGRRGRRGGRKRGLREKRRGSKDEAWPQPSASSSAPAPKTPPSASPGDSSSGGSSPA